MKCVVLYMYKVPGTKTYSQLWTRKNLQSVDTAIFRVVSDFLESEN